MDTGVYVDAPVDGWWRSYMDQKHVRVGSLARAGRRGGQFATHAVEASE